MSTASPVQICNIALGWLGQGSITSFEDRSRTAQLCKDNYDLLRDALLESRCWTFAEFKKVSTSSQVPGRVDGNENTYAENGWPEWGEGFVHYIDSQFLKVFRVYRDSSMDSDNQAVWGRHGEYVIADQETIYMWGVRRVEDTDSFSELFVQALAGRIAADLCVPITQNRALQVDMWSLFNDKMSEAAARDGQQGRNETVGATRLRRARMR